jgi:hypothetical protein
LYLLPLQSTQQLPLQRAIDAEELRDRVCVKHRHRHTNGEHTICRATTLYFCFDLCVINRSEREREREKEREREREKERERERERYVSLDNNTRANFGRYRYATQAQARENRRCIRLYYDRENENAWIVKQTLDVCALPMRPRALCLCLSYFNGVSARIRIRRFLCVKHRAKQDYKYVSQNTKSSHLTTKVRKIVVRL